MRIDPPERNRMKGPKNKRISARVIPFSRDPPHHGLRCSFSAPPFNPQKKGPLKKTRRQLTHKPQKRAPSKNTHTQRHTFPHRDLQVPFRSLARFLRTAPWASEGLWQLSARPLSRKAPRGEVGDLVQWVTCNTTNSLAEWMAHNKSKLCVCH